MKRRVKITGGVAIAAAATLIVGGLLHQPDFKTDIQLQAPYNRNDYMPNGRWSDTDGDCQDTRQEVLIEESLEPVSLDQSGCRVLQGAWWDAYTARMFTDPGELDIDHVVPLAEAHRSCAWAWSAAKKQAFANDLSNPDHLMAVSAGANRSKGDRDPAAWRPENDNFWMEYSAAYIGVKQRWGLCFDTAERAALKVSGLKPCE